MKALDVLLHGAGYIFGISQHGASTEYVWIAIHEQTINLSADQMTAPYAFSCHVTVLLDKEVLLCAYTLTLCSHTILQ